MNTKDEVKALWKLCFDDSDEFTDLYFRMRYKDEINRVVREGGRVVSALQMIPYPMTFCGGVIPVSYISGACTHPACRKRGVMRRLLEETHRYMYEEGVLLALLIPAEERLFGYYARSGYVPAFGYAMERVQADGLCPSPEYKVEVCECPDAEHYRYFDSHVRMRRSCILHTMEDWEVIMADMRLSDARLLVACEAGRIVGMAFAVMNGDTLYIKELLTDTDAARDSLLYEAAYIYKVQTMVCFLPSSAGTLYRGMARVIHAEKMLRIFARNYPEVECYIHVEGDEAIAENNGYYTLKGGVCRRGRMAEKEYRYYTPHGLTRFLLEAEHSYMSLMLD
ncbi:GNAT family N-acetyltransferase [Phocaeicola sp.]|uniref:GNAT family N-acetyltransferase n=1 Tax=Phocaeicola sp. TaxID=2773926 RepID=UPI0023CF3DFB|nr:GNAT family N-acetyltransferase [Phocaeicola sp.]MDE5676662.1 GNAT family N-acetyltransferase [Phocaeicola sp.]